MQSELALLEKRIDDVVHAVRAVRAKLDKELPEPAKRWRANEEENYWCINEAGTAVKYTDSGHDIDNFNYSKGNYFKCKEDAEQCLKNLKTKQKLKDLALKLNNGKEIDWSDMEQTKFFIVLNCTKDYLEQNHTYRICDVGQVHCLDRGFLTRAIMEIGKDNLINLIKSGV